MSLPEAQMTKALKLLNQKLKNPLRLIMGGGGALLLAHHIPLVTSDIDAIPGKGFSPEQLDPLIKEVAHELNITPDWLNTYYGTFTHVLPSDYETRLIRILDLNQLCVDALSKEDLLIMKCFAGRQKDITHAKALIKKGVNKKLVESHLESLKKKNIPGSDHAIDFFDEINE